MANFHSLRSGKSTSCSHVGIASVSKQCVVVNVFYKVVLSLLCSPGSMPELGRVGWHLSTLIPLSLGIKDMQHHAWLTVSAVIVMKMFSSLSLVLGFC